jgi:hypothetical protein
MTRAYGYMRFSMKQRVFKAELVPDHMQMSVPYLQIANFFTCKCFMPSLAKGLSKSNANVECSHLHNVVAVKCNGLVQSRARWYYNHMPNSGCASCPGPFDIPKSMGYFRGSLRPYRPISHQCWLERGGTRAWASICLRPS